MNTGVGTPASIRTPLGMTSQINQTPSMNLGKLDSAAIQRAAAGLPSSVYNTLAQVAGQTPGFPGQGFSYGAGFNFQSVSITVFPIGLIGVLSFFLWIPI